MKKFLSNRKDDKKIGIDLDGVIIDHSKNMQCIIMELLGEKIPLAQCVSDFVKDVFPPEKLEEVQKIIYGKMSLIAPVMANVCGVLTRLKNSGAELYIVSRRRNDVLGKKWIKKNLPDIIPPGNVFFVSEPEEKSETAQTLGLRYFIDDQKKILNLMPAETEKMYFDQFNQFSDSSEYKRVRDWMEIEDFLAQLGG